jgi:hypothetical protein
VLGIPGVDQLHLQARGLGQVVVELRPPSSGTSKIRILFAFDPWRSAILLVAGNKEGKWNRWYTEAIPKAEQLYEVYLKERAEEEPS